MSKDDAVTTPSAAPDVAAQVSALEAENARLRAELRERSAQGLQAPDWPPEVWKAIGYSPEEYRRNHPDNAPPAVDSATGTQTAAPPVPAGE